MSESEILKEFLIESYENLDRLDRELVGLEKNPNDAESLAGVFRTIHTIKGTCGFLGFRRLEKVAHAGENLLTVLRDGELVLNPEITTALLRMVDAVRQMLDEIERTGQDGDIDYPELREGLEKLQSNVPGASAPVSAGEPASDLQKEVASQVPYRGENPRPAQASETIASKPPESARRKGDSARKPTRGKIGGLLVERGKAQAGDIALALQEQEKGDRRRLGEILVALGLAKLEDVIAAQQILDSRPHDTTPETIRVGVTLLDKLMTLVGELVLARNQLLQISNKVDDTGLHAVSQRMDLIATELQEEVMKTRMQPIGNIWAQFPRTVRDVALGCGKEVEIEMEGKETELDKTIIEAIKDPLTHLVRNSVDHGIELPDVRVQAGKERAGRLILRAFHEGGQVNIEISDDGAGLSAERIRQKAVERGIVSAELGARMSDRDVFNLIFLPGFSTAEKVTNVSGRGVGMDVVKTNVEKIGGLVDLQSTLGRGTTVRVKIPLTLAIIPALIVTCAGDRYAIPQVNLLELVRLEAEGHASIEMVHGAPVYRLRGQLLPLVYLRHELKLGEPVPNAPGTAGAVNIVVLQADERQFGLVVDAINDTEEIVVKPLRQQLKMVKTFAGSSIMGDGTVALILDVLGLAQRANVIDESRERSSLEKLEPMSGVTEEKKTFLLFAGLGDSRMAIPLSSVARLEEFPISQIEMSGKEWVTQYRGQILPLVRLSAVMEERRHRLRTLPALPAADVVAVPVLVLNHDGRLFGLVVERILDIVEDRADVKSKAMRPLVLYSTVIANRVTELLDIPGTLLAAGVSTPQIARSRSLEGVVS